MGTRRVARRGTGHGTALTRTAFGLMALTTVFGALFIAGETFSDPGGWAAVGMVSAWALPGLVVGILAWRHPDRGLQVLGSLVGVMVLLGAWCAVDPTGFRELEVSRGPVRAIATFAIAAVIALVGLRRPAIAGIELVVLAVVPPLLASLGTRAGSPSLLAASMAPLLAGVLYLASAAARSDAPAR